MSSSSTSAPPQSPLHPADRLRLCSYCKFGRRIPNAATFFECRPTAHLEAVRASPALEKTNEILHPFRVVVDHHRERYAGSRWPYNFDESFVRFCAGWVANQAFESLPEVDRLRFDVARTERRLRFQAVQRRPEVGKIK